MQRAPPPKKSEGLTDAVVGRRAGYDSVVVVWITLRLRQRLVAARGAANEVELAGETAGPGMDDQFGVFGHHVDGAVGVVDHLRRMALPELQPVARMAGIV